MTTKAHDVCKEIDLYLFKIKQLLKVVTYEDEYDVNYRKKIEDYRKAIKQK